MSNTPSDAELQALWEESDHPLPQNFARAVLAKWGTPQPVAREPLSDAQIADALIDLPVQGTGYFLRIARAIEQAHGITQKGGS